MKNFFFSSLIALLFLVSVNAQTPSPTVTPNPSEKNDDVVKISTTLIQVDVTVTGKDGRILYDLQPEDFEIYQNGKKQNITNFSLIQNSLLPSANISVKNAGNAGIPVAPVRLKPEQVRRTIALVIDDLGLSFGSMHYLKQALKKFVDEQVQPNDLVAIIRTSGGAGVSQQFTSDKKQLYAVVENLKWSLSSRSEISNAQTSTMAEKAQAVIGKSDEEQLKRERAMLQTVANLREEVFAAGSLGAVNYIINGMKELPGRKSIILFSDGFSLNPKPDDSEVGERLRVLLRRLTELANRAAVTIYTQQAIEMNPSGITAADDLNVLSVRQIQEKFSFTRSQDFNKQDGLKYLAKETGGRAFFGDQFNENLGKALVDQSGYYLIGYQPDEDTFDPAKQMFNKLQVKVKRKDVDVRFRSGFFSAPDSKIVPTKLTPVQEIAKALMSPFSYNDINLRLNTIPANDDTSGLFLQSFLHIKGSDLKFSPEADGKYKASFDVLAAIFGAGGEAVDQIGQSYAVNIDKEGYDKLLREGFVYSFIFPIKKAGAYQMRVALRDNTTSKFGSATQFVELPDLKKNLLATSGIVLENLSSQQWEILKSNLSNSETPNGKGNSYLNTSLRQFKRGTYLRYGLEIYNSKLGKNQKPDLQTQIKIFHEGKQILEGKITPLDLAGQANLKRIKFAGTVNIGKAMAVGEYILQIIVKDNAAKEKDSLTAQSVQFEIVN